ncbi:helix-turn-helix domain-containing protein [Streptomyces polychromogenes]|nr:helix-turn-helix domain-containing protein [Streptomyces polychromogenes]
MTVAPEALCFGDVLQRSRKRVGLTQEQLAGLSTVSVRAIRDLELGRAHRPRQHTVRLLADALRLSGSHRVLLESAAGRPSGGGALRQMYAEGAAAPPAPTGPLLGRETELGVVGDALGRERLVSLVGLAGVGKTRLALEVVRRADANGSGPTLWLSGSDAAGPSGRTVDQPRAMFTSWMSDRLAGWAPVDELAGLIGDRPTLLVVDAYESLPVTPEPLLQLLRRCAGLRVLITTREPQPFMGVCAIPLPPLPFERPARTGTDGEDAVPPAVELLLSQLRYTRPTLSHTERTRTAVADICRALDGVPLALDLAAAWFPVYSPEQLAPMAQESPLDLLEPVFGDDAATGTGLRSSVQAAVAALRPGESALLRELARQPDARPAGELLAGAGLPLGEATRALHALLQRGLVRQERTAEGTDAVAVLNLVRRVLAYGATCRFSAETAADDAKG